MRTVIKGTWLATALFVVPLLALELVEATVSPSVVGTFSLGAILVTPPVWWWLVARREKVGPARGAAAGSLCAALIVLIPTIYVVSVMAGRRPSYDGGLADAQGIAYFVFVWVIAIPVGAGLGALAVTLNQGRHIQR
jgi:hypothetical protein